jgi:hypothetical protein
LTGGSGTSSAVAHDDWRLGALVLIGTEPPAHYERVLVRCFRVQTLCQLQVHGLLLVAAVDC